MRPPIKVNDGVQPYQWVKWAITQGYIKSSAPRLGQVQPCSLDLTLASGYTEYLRATVVNALDAGAVRSSGTPFNDDKHDLLGLGAIALFKLAETLDLPANIHAVANPKSTAGRLDIHVRLLTEQGMFYDVVPAGYKGVLWALVTTNSFSIDLRPGDALLQLRFIAGKSRVSDAAMRRYHREVEPILYGTRSRNSDNAFTLDGDGPLWLSLDTRARYTARKNTGRAVGYSQPGGYPVNDFWSAIAPTIEGVATVNTFTLFASGEYLSIPPTFCAVMVPFDVDASEARMHYAGFLDAGFGYGPAGDHESLARVVAEVRVHGHAHYFARGMPAFRLQFHKMAEVPELLYGSATLASHYQGQELALPRQFAAPRP